VSVDGGFVFLGHTKTDINADVNNSGSDIIDRIDALVDESLARPFAQRSGYDNNIHQDLCGHCDRAWHGLPITQAVADMYAIAEFDETYSVAGDDTEIVCAGSDFIGPMKHAPVGPISRYGSFGAWAFSDWWDGLRAFSNLTVTFLQNRWWGCTLPTDCEVDQDNRDGWWLQVRTSEAIFNFRLNPDELFIIPTQPGQPTQIAVLAATPPDIGVTWEPLTAPGCTELPESFR